MQWALQTHSGPIVKTFANENVYCLKAGLLGLFLGFLKVLYNVLPIINICWMDTSRDIIDGTHYKKYKVEPLLFVNEYLD